MRIYPDDDEGLQEAFDKLACEPWLLEELRRNPSYPHWGPHEDYQWVNDSRDPDSPREFSDWQHFKRCFTVGKHPEDTADRSGGEVVNWYFDVQRASRGCRDCDGSGLNPETKCLSDEWYDFQHPRGDGWSKYLTQDEVDALQQAGRLDAMCSMSTLEALERVVVAGKIGRAEAVARWEGRDQSLDVVRKDGEVYNRTVFWRDHVPADEVNTAYQDGMGHDGINHAICVEARAKRLGVYGLCSSCEGEGHLPTEPHARLCLVLWVVNPRTGQNYGVEVLSVRQEELAEVYEFVLSCGRRVAAGLDLPQDASFSDLRTLADERPADWTQAGSCLDGDPRYPHSWREPVFHETWKDMRDVRDLLGKRLSPEDPRYATAGKSWTLDCYNELLAIHVEPGGRLHAWMAHPRKGASRRVTVGSFDDDDLPDIVAWVREGRERALRRFACRLKE